MAASLIQFSCASGWLRSPIVCIFFLLVFSPVSTYAVDFSPQLASSVNAVSNVSLAPSGDEDAALVSQLLLGGRLTERSRYTQLEADYQYSQYTFFLSDTRNTDVHTGRGEFSHELIDNFLFLDISGSYSQIYLSDSVQTSSQHFQVGGNTQDLVVASAGPRFEAGLPGEGRLHMSSQLARTEYLGSSAYDSVLLSNHLNAENMHSSSRLKYRTRIEATNIRTAGGQYIDVRQLSAATGYAVLDNVSILVGGRIAEYSGGEMLDLVNGRYDDSVFVLSSYQIADRGRIEAQIDWRDYGESYYFDFRYQHKAVSVEAGYSEDIVSTAVSQLARISESTDPERLFETTFSQAEIRSDFVLTKRLHAGIRLELPRIEIASGMLIDNTEDAVGPLSDAYGVNLNITRALSRRTDLAVRYDGRKTIPTGGQAFWQTGAEMAFETQWGRSVFTQLGYLADSRAYIDNALPGYISHIAYFGVRLAL